VFTKQFKLIVFGGGTSPVFQIEKFKEIYFLADSFEGIARHADSEHGKLHIV
jgi:hypothetical protein